MLKFCTCHVNYLVCVGEAGSMRHVATQQASEYYTIDLDDILQSQLHCYIAVINAKLDAALII